MQNTLGQKVVQGRLRTPMKALRKPILKELNWLRDRNGKIKRNSREPNRVEKNCRVRSHHDSWLHSNYGSLSPQVNVVLVKGTSFCSRQKPLQKITINWNAGWWSPVPTTLSTNTTLGPTPWDLCGQEATARVIAEKEAERVEGTEEQGVCWEIVSPWILKSYKEVS